MRWAIRGGSAEAPLHRPAPDTVRWLADRNPRAAEQAGCTLIASGPAALVVRDRGWPAPGERTIWLGADPPEGCWARLAADTRDAEIAAWIAAGVEIGRAEARASRAEAWLDEGAVAGLVGASDAHRALIRRIRRLAPLAEPALIHGPAGSGKTQVALAIHRLGPPGPLRVVALGEVAGPAVEREVALALDATDAEGRRGTLLLEDVDQLPSAAARLLRAGRDGPRLIGTTRLAPRDLPRWPGDLRDSLVDGALAVPTLADRGPDIELIANTILAEEGTGRHLTADGAAWLRTRAWAGGVRELAATVRRAARAGSGPLGPADLAGPEARGATPEARERDLVLRALAASGGDVCAVARELGIPRSTLYRRLQRWGHGA